MAHTDINDHAGSPTSTWTTTDPVRLSPESLIDLLEGRIPLIKKEAFLTAESLAKLEHVLEDRFTPYLNTTGPKVDKIGVAQFEFQAQKQEDFSSRTGLEKEQYFAAVRDLDGSHEELAREVGVNMFEKVFKTFASMIPANWEICLASESAHEQYYAGIIRGINNGTPIHCDWVPFDTLTESWAITRVTHQAVFNLYLSDVDGGDTEIHEVQWTPQALTFRDPMSYGYFPDLVKGSRSTRFHPAAGDLYVFNSRNMHQVFPVQTGCNKRRMAMASFFGVLPPLDGEKTKLIFWS